MLQEFKRTTNIGVGIGWLLTLIGNVLSREHTSISGLLGGLLIVVGIGLFLWGCGQYAKGKGYSGYWGALGLLYLVGLVVLFLFPDRHKELPKV